jgi:hypothetical protein
VFSKINIFGIVQAHIHTLRNYRTNKLHYPDIVLFIFLPLIISVLLVYLDFPLNDGMVNALITSFSIFAALLFNLLLLVYGLTEKENGKPNVSNDKLSILREIYINVSFCILVSVITTIILLAYFLRTKNCLLFKIDVCYFRWIQSLIAYYLSFQFLLTLLMILKRIYKLLEKDFKNRY